MAEPTPPGRLLALDLETTGLDPRRHAIVAVGCVPVEGRSILWGRAYRALVDDPRSGRPPDLGALGTHQVLPEEQRGGLGLPALVDLVAGQTEGGAVTEDVLEALRIPYLLLDDPAHVERRIAQAQTLAVSSNKPVALLLCRDLMWEEPA